MVTTKDEKKMLMMLVAKVVPLRQHLSCVSFHFQISSRNSPDFLLTKSKKLCLDIEAINNDNAISFSVDRGCLSVRVTRIRLA